MNRNLPELRYRFSFSFFPFLFFAAICIFLLFSLNSCETGLKGRYKFQSESHHWLQFRGPNASGIAPENADPPVHFSADTNLLWKTEIMPGWSSPCIVDEKIFLTGFNDADSLLYTMAINRENGEMAWKVPLNPNGFYYRHSLHGYANPTVASDGERIFASFPNYGLVAYDLEGKMVWEYPHEVISFYYNAGSSSPIIADDNIVLIVNSEKDPRIIALDAGSGDPAWITRVDDFEWKELRCSSTPVYSNGLLIIHLANAVVALNMEDGNPEWWLPTLTTGVGTPVIKDSLIFVSTWSNLGEESARGELPTFEELLKESDTNNNGIVEQDEIRDDMLVFERPETPDAPMANLYANDDQNFSFFDADKDKAFNREEWQAMLEILATFMKEHGMLAIPLQGKKDRPYTDIAWKVNADTPETPSPLVVGENVLFIKDGGILTVINRKSGELVHKERIGATGTYLSSPMLAGNRIYTCSFNGMVTVLSADDFKIITHNDLKEKIGASLVAVDDVLYIRTDKYLYAFRNQ